MSRSVWLVFAALLASCGSSEVEATSATDETVAQACQATKDLHNEIIDVANAAAAAEVDASEAERAVILADGFDLMIDVAESGALAAGPVDLVDGLIERRVAVVADGRIAAAAFREEWVSVSSDDRGSAVSQLFVWGEKLMSETEPRLGIDADDQLIALVRNAAACQNVIQLP